jgi:cytochrome c oxidase subunit 4
LGTVEQHVENRAGKIRQPGGGRGFVLVVRGPGLAVYFSDILSFVSFMNDSPEQELKDVKKRVQQHIIIAVGLALGSLMTLWTSQTDFGSFTRNVSITLGIASVQAFMIAAFFMHLLSEKKLIYWFLVLTAVFFVVMIGITFWARMDANVVHYH